MMITAIIKVRVSPNLIANNLAAKPGELANLHKGTLTNRVGNKHHVGGGDKSVPGFEHGL